MSNMDSHTGMDIEIITYGILNADYDPIVCSPNNF